MKTLGKKVNAYTCDKIAPGRTCYCVGPENCGDRDCSIVKAHLKEKQEQDNA